MKNASKLYTSLVARIVAAIAIANESRGVVIRHIVDVHTLAGEFVPSRAVNGMLQEDCAAFGIEAGTMANYCSQANGVMADTSKAAKQFLAGEISFYEYSNAAKAATKVVVTTAKPVAKAARKAAKLNDVKAAAKTLTKKDRIALVAYVMGL